MTTRIHIVNFGPKAVEVEALTPIVFPKKLYAQESADFYVYDGQDVHVTEAKEETPSGK